jgi:ATP-binding cassette subfamily B protein
MSYLGDDGSPSGRAALKNINLVAEPGQMVAILGATGSGKSSLIHLIPRFYDVTEGRVTIDGVDVRDVKLADLRQHMGIALQQAILFSGTVRDNVRYGRPEANEDEIVEVAQAADAHGFVSAQVDGYDSAVAREGANFSGGQRQRISIARALTVKPKILILDDSTSAVDVATETRIQAALGEMLHETTTFVVAQRISTVLIADKIIVLDNGEIVAEGNHDELLTCSSIYREIYESQLGGLEA